MTQSASRVILIRPVGFGFDPETAPTNAFQQRLTDPDVRVRAEEEFDMLLGALDRCGIGTMVLDPADPKAPNSVFPNNWFSTHSDGTLVLYSMCSPSRRTERDPAFDKTLEREGFEVKKVMDLSPLEKNGKFLEGTGSLVIDRRRNIVYAAVGPRTSERGINLWCGAMEAAPVTFQASMDGTLAGQPVYHTNVLMSIGERFVLACLDALPYPVDRDDLWAELDRSDREIIPISLDQMHRYCGNLLELRSPKGSFVFLSETAFQALKPDQRMSLEKHAQLVPVPVPTIETVGGGSVRCMIAENFLPSR
jgi:hypothetical protein